MFTDKNTQKLRGKLFFLNFIVVKPENNHNIDFYT